jgi:hypothetical protein
MNEEGAFVPKFDREIALMPQFQPLRAKAIHA